MSVREKYKKTHRSFRLSCLGLPQTRFTGVQVQAKILQETPLFLKYTQ